ncbi:MAG: arylesterase, partial [Methylohalobius sp.]|nr:arylesterase [Methylohalobius sp.]
VLVLGDSLSAAYGIPVDQGWVALLEAQLKQKHKDLRFVNASISGETTAGGKHRLPALLAQHRPHVVILELGGNDGLRGITPVETEQNLAAMIEASLATSAKVILLGTKLPPNYGPKFVEMFEVIYQRLAQRYPITLLSFFLEDVALNAELMQADGIHPNLRAQPLLAQKVRQALAEVLD